MKAAKNTKPKLPRVLTFETVKAYKANLRRYDAKRLADGVDALTIQRENSILPAEVTSFKIINFT